MSSASEAYQKGLEVLMHGKWLRSVALVGFVVMLGAVSARAMDAIDFNLSAAPLQATKHASTTSDDDEDDEDSFFSNDAKGRNMAVDLAATCRAVLADSLNDDNHNFIHGCQQAVTQRGH